MKYSFNYSDSDYKDAINYDGTNYYNCPVTITIDGKKFVLSVGTSDTISVKKFKGDSFLFIIGKNTGLEYMSLTRINLIYNSIEETYLQGSDIDYIMGESVTKQINFLSEYL